MKFTVKTTGNWAEVKEFETLKEALQEFEMVAQGNFHYYIAKGVEEPYEVTLETETEDGTVHLLTLTQKTFKGTSTKIGREYMEVIQDKEDGTVMIIYINLEAPVHTSRRYAVQYDC